MPRLKKERQTELKHKLAKLLSRGVHSKADLARSLGISYNTVGVWIDEYQENLKQEAAKNYSDEVVVFKRVLDKIHDLQVESWNALATAKNENDTGKIGYLINTINGLIRTEIELLNLKGRNFFEMVKEVNRETERKHSQDYLDLKAFMKAHNLTATQIAGKAAPPSLIRPPRKREESETN